ncbi:UDP-N-acetylmuramate dehydrogenase [Parasphingorhabdus halotolerans]|uniref:UDP-N-acetylenolpyruvoylglucosamine reductase n=1 Tax=Parasphingorhabdus halotolerans TaxID=2725558 RepID=A0A6H2DKV8_9SPHN|nr:UDP-N-acetylmuramate dehydrogenase [Parasphingorhabdus halotolerans]QJB69020.1 UDP-N-acetylmuramate dehydrogenase [Parasphingorhabdus halotolerans]
MSAVLSLPETRGKLTADAPLAKLVWFKTGGPAQWLFEPKDIDDLQQFLRDLDPEIAVWPLGLGSNLIIRDGGIKGVVIRLGKAFGGIKADGLTLTCGAGAPGISAASMARDHAIAGMEFLRGIPGTIGGAVRMNAGAYGREMCDILESADIVLRTGELKTIPLAEMGYTYRHSALPDGAVVVSAKLRGQSGDSEIIAAEMKRIGDEREASQPLRTKTGGSTFKNPDGYKAWQLVDEAGCRGLTIGQAQVSEKHCNFLINLGGATSVDIEALGEEVRKRVRAHSGVELQWEIQRVGEIL